MSGARYLPSLPEISREAIAVIVGALIAAAFFAAVPPLRQWVAERMPWR